jgi:glycerol-3-phosphate dehydrogenase subunit B
VRPLYQETKASDSRDISRSFVLLDHEERDGLKGFVTITSGKWTTYRKMAQVTVDLICEKLGGQRECQTHLVELPAADHGSGFLRRGARPKARSQHFLGERLARVESNAAYGELICECELATVEDVVEAIHQGNAQTLDDIRRDVRLGMGPCQGGFCTLRAAGILHKLARTNGQGAATNTNAAIRDFLEERWKGLLPVLWGQQLHQERLNELIYVNVLNIDHLPGPKASRLAPQPYRRAEYPVDQSSATPRSGSHVSSQTPMTANGKPPLDLLVIGAGLAGLTAAWRAAQRGLQVKVIAKGWGATHWGAGCVDVFGYAPENGEDPLEKPDRAIQELIEAAPQHPYSLIGLEKLDYALRAVQALFQKGGYLLHGSIERNWLLPSAAGAFRPTCLAPETMIAGDLRSPEPLLLVGFGGYHDFCPHLAADNLRAQGIEARAIEVVLPSLQKRRRVDTMTLMHLFEREDFRAEAAGVIQPHLNEKPRVGLPAVLGLRAATRVLRDLEDRLACRVFELPGLPPSVPGMRLHHVLVEAIQQAGGQVLNGMEVQGMTAKNGRIEAVWAEAAARKIPHRAANYIVSTGGFLGDGIRVDHRGRVREMVFDLPVTGIPARGEWFQSEFLSAQGQRLYRSGVSVGPGWQPVDAEGKLLYKNLYAAGGALAHHDPLRERSLEGVGLATGYQAGEAVP